MSSKPKSSGEGDAGRAWSAEVTRLFKHCAGRVRRAAVSGRGQDLRHARTKALEMTHRVMRRMCCSRPRLQKELATRPEITPVCGTRPIRPIVDLRWPGRGKAKRTAKSPPKAAG